MTSNKSDDYYLEKMTEYLHSIISDMKSIDYETVVNDKILQDAMMFRLIQISENSKKISLEYKSMHEDIPWVAILGLRNRIVHDYGNVDMGIVFDTLSIDIPVTNTTLSVND